MFYLLLAVTVALFVGGIWLAMGYEFEVLGAVTATLSGLVLLFFFMIGWPCTYTSTVDDIAMYKATQLTLTESRTAGFDALERATIQREVITMNQKIASAQYWNSTILDPMYPDAVMQLELIK